MSLLSVAGVTAKYGASQALFDVSFTIAEGQVLALMGRNGMGKSTTIKTICRLLPISGGEIRFAGQNLAGLPAHKAARIGLGLVPEGRRCFADLSVTENLIAAARPGHWTEARVAALFPRLDERKSQVARSLSGGEQQMLAIGRALMTNPRLLILDEATEGLAPIVRQEIWDAIARLKVETGLSILVVDKSLTDLARVADTATILQRGRTVWSGSFSQLGPEITAQYLGV
ncbi:ABC transporter ATP-binding protein [Pseudoruegeria sp. SK021]|uniref:ABC transporter ATP-binding protein n=1 Tax=Pseudoruegeria sp. SK021 TaxID=1933035 RepID=UPI000A21EAB4|nr:ABC transporter ATP-binding protein [Pseudoruegeria sp. SK021]OSP56488.1 ABC transporter ATP-binding protein [Pseudoruegeria sp. SK021]